jgi:hypothetical protein
VEWRVAGGSVIKLLTKCGQEKLTCNFQLDLLSKLVSRISRGDLAFVCAFIRGVDFFNDEVPLVAVGHVLGMYSRVLHPRHAADRQGVVMGQLPPRHLNTTQT